MSQEEKNEVEVGVSLSRRKEKQASEDCEEGTVAEKMAKDEVKTPASPKLVKKKPKKFKVKFPENNEFEEQKLIEQEIDKLLKGDEIDANELFGITEEVTEGDQAVSPKEGEDEDEPSLAKLAGIEISDDRRTSQEECLKSWMERRLNDENKQ